jgi:hypothetical protein
VTNERSFFHWVANLNRRNNLVEALAVNGLVSSNQSIIREHFVQYYDGLFSEQFSWQPKLDGLVFYSISMVDSLGLDSPFEEI